jgi:hypothetical protein
MYTVVYYLFMYNFTDHCHRVETKLQLINISYHKNTIKNQIKLVYIKINGVAGVGYVLQKQVRYYDVSRQNGGSAV